MSSTLATMRARLADDFLDSLLSAAQINTAINRAIIHYQTEPFWFTQTSDTFSTVASQQSYTTADGVASDILSIDYVKILISGNNTNLRPTEFPELQRRTYNSSDLGQPSVFAWGLSKIWLYPIPDGAYTVTMYYRKSYSELSADADTNDWLTYAEDLIEARATLWLASRITKDRETMQVAMSDENMALSALRRKDRHLNPVTELKATGF